MRAISEIRSVGRVVVMVALSVLVAGAAWARSRTTDPNGAPNEPSFVKDGEVDVDAVVKYFEDLYRSDSSISEAKLIVTKPRRQRTLEMKMWTRGEERALVLIQSPAREKGTATLKVEKNLWNYLPRIKRTIRIPPSMMLASWMGSDFTNDDLVKESSYSKDYVYELVGPSADPKGWRVRFNAKPDIVGLWNRFELVLSEDARIPLQAEYYDRKDRLARRMRWSDVKVFDGKRIPAHMTLIPEDKDGHKTEMIYLDIKFDVDVPESTFSLANLEQKR
ncbi:MAG: outer membrane lipoprotein-sorting protein [Phycisphaerales bacterium]|nr:MAG: outer membrane lipoprotein-sorting protein [Phycisphaerales bacterium]